MSLKAVLLGLAAVAAVGLVCAAGEAPGGGAGKAPGGGAGTGKPADPMAFVNDVMPLVSALGCNQTACHGSARGKGGFRLSMFGAEPADDYEALAKAAQARRINRVEPAKSLFLLKATAAITHGGGQRLQAGSPEYALLAAWVAQGAPWGDEKLPKIVSVKVTPEEQLMPKGETRQLQVTAVFSNGTQKDVTRHALYKSADGKLVSVDAGGKLKAEDFGQSAVIVSYLRQVALARIAVPHPLSTPFPKIEPNNKIDELVFAKLQKLGFPPSELCSEEVFLRRAYLDLIGLLPKPEEVRAYLADPDPKKRGKLIDRLLDREEYADFWTLKWGDLLRIKSEYPVRVWPRGVLTYYRWVRASIAANKPYDQFARELITANGSDFRVGPANYYRAVQKREPQTYAEATAVLFMGARLDCARCHGHPTENWALDDSLGMAAFFSKVAIKVTQEWKEEIVFSNQYGGVYHPRTRQYVNPKPLGAEALNLPHDQDPRAKFADWLTSPQNPWFAKTMANRVWYWLLGRGIVHEPDDFRSTNPPSNLELLDYLTQELVAHKFDVKHLFRLILNSKTYQLSSKATELNRGDMANFSHRYLRRMGAEQVLDAVCQVSGAPDQFASWIPVPPTIMPIGSRAAQVFDGDIRNPLLDLFGRPPRDTPYECERKLGGSVRQSLHLVNSDHFEGKIAGSPNLQRLLQANKPDPETIDEVYLATLSRFPRADERQKVVDYISGAGKKVPPQLEADKKAADEALGKLRGQLQQASAALDAAEKAAKEAESAATATATAATQAGTAQTNAERAAAVKCQQAADAKKRADDLAQQSQQRPADATPAALVRALTESAAADKALADAKGAVVAALQTGETAEKAAQEAAARAKAISEDAKKSDAEKKQAADEAAAKRKAADDVKTLLPLAQQKQQQAQTAAYAASGKLTEAEAQKKAAEEALARLLAQVPAAIQAYQSAEKAAREAEAPAAQAKTAADTARTAQTAAATAVAAKRKLAADAKAARDKVQADEKAAAAKSAEAAKKLADATAALKPPRHQAFQDLLWALMNTKEFLFNH